MATHSSILAWKIPWTEKPAGGTVHGIAKSWTQLRHTHTHTHTHTHRGTYYITFCVCSEILCLVQCPGSSSNYFSLYIL